MDDHTILANEENFGNVSVCPGGVVHINLAHVNLKFLPEDFVRFSRLIHNARQSFQATRIAPGKPRLHVVAPESSDDPPADKDK